MAAALASAAAEQPTDPGMVYFGEVGLSGEVRQVAQAEARLKEAQKLGFDRAPACRAAWRAATARLAAPDGLALHEIGHLSDLVARFCRQAQSGPAMRIGVGGMTRGRPIYPASTASLT